MVVAVQGWDLRFKRTKHCKYASSLHRLLHLHNIAGLICVKQSCLIANTLPHTNTMPALLLVCHVHGQILYALEGLLFDLQLVCFHLFPNYRGFYSFCLLFIWKRDHGWVSALGLVLVFEAEGRRGDHLWLNLFAASVRLASCVLGVGLLVDLACPSNRQVVGLLQLLLSRFYWTHGLDFVDDHALLACRCEFLARLHRNVRLFECNLLGLRNRLPEKTGSYEVILLWWFYRRLLRDWRIHEKLLAALLKQLLVEWLERTCRQVGFWGENALVQVSHLKILTVGSWQMEVI